MPNWCEHKLTVIGEHDHVMTFIRQARGEFQHYAPSQMDIIFEAQRKAHCLKEGIPFVSDLERHKEHVDFSFHQLFPIPAETMAREYDPYGYNKETEQWGVKWGASGSKLVSYKDGVANYTFRTPWAPAMKFFEKVAADWKDLTFADSWAEEYPTRGRFIFSGGLLIESTNEKPSGRYNRNGWSNGYTKIHAKWIRTTVHPQ